MEPLTPSMRSPTRSRASSRKAEACSQSTVCGALASATAPPRGLLTCCILPPGLTARVMVFSAGSACRNPQRCRSSVSAYWECSPYAAAKRRKRNRGFKLLLSALAREEELVLILRLLCAFLLRGFWRRLLWPASAFLPGCRIDKGIGLTGFARFELDCALQNAAVRIWVRRQPAVHIHRDFDAGDLRDAVKTFDELLAAGDPIARSRPAHEKCLMGRAVVEDGEFGRKRTRRVTRVLVDFQRRVAERQNIAFSNDHVALGRRIGPPAFGLTRTELLHHFPVFIEGDKARARQLLNTRRTSEMIEMAVRKN